MCLLLLMIKAIPLCNTPQPDLLYWTIEKNGVYSVKSGYRALCEEARNEEASGSSSVLSTGFWSSIWKLKVPGKRKWQPPNPGEYKTNLDGAMFTVSDEAGLGVVVRDSNGLVVAAMAEKMKQPHSVECLEMLAARRAVIFVKEIGLQESHFEGDSELVIKELQRDGSQNSSIWAFG
uniref:RNase H type-1 domain-containing protein n=1 Tax=Quercus lobata TaxID=97700 RepID=A0A7N2L7F5_QUELO